MSRRFVADCLSQAERLCYKPYVAERRPRASYTPGLLSRTHIGCRGLVVYPDAPSPKLAPSIPLAPAQKLESYRSETLNPQPYKGGYKGTWYAARTALVYSISSLTKCKSKILSQRQGLRTSSLIPERGSGFSASPVLQGIQGVLAGQIARKQLSQN